MKTLYATHVRLWNPCKGKLIFDISHLRWYNTRFSCSEPHSVEIADIFNLRIAGLHLVSSHIQRALLAIIVKWVERTFEFLDFTITCQSTNKQSAISDPWQHCFKGILTVLISFMLSTFIGFCFTLNGVIAQSNSSLRWIYWLFYAKKSIEVTFAALATKKET